MPYGRVGGARGTHSSLNDLGEPMSDISSEDDACDSSECSFLSWKTTAIAAVSNRIAEEMTTET